MNEIIYPDYEIGVVRIQEQPPLFCRLSGKAFTHIRKKNRADDLYYLIPVLTRWESKITIAEIIDEYDVERISRELKEALLKRFLHEVYRTIMVYKVDPRLRNMYGDQLLTLDELQITERERLGI